MYDPIKQMYAVVEWNEDMNTEPLTDEVAQEILNAEKERQEYEKNKRDSNK